MSPVLIIQYYSIYILKLERTLLEHSKRQLLTNYHSSFRSVYTILFLLEYSIIIMLLSLQLQICVYCSFQNILLCYCQPPFRSVYIVPSRIFYYVTVTLASDLQILFPSRTFYYVTVTLASETYVQCYGIISYWNDNLVLLLHIRNHEIMLYLCSMVWYKNYSRCICIGMVRMYVFCICILSLYDEGNYICILQSVMSIVRQSNIATILSL